MQAIQQKVSHRDVKPMLCKKGCTVTVRHNRSHTRHAVAHLHLHCSSREHAGASLGPSEFTHNSSYSMTQSTRAWMTKTEKTKTCCPLKRQAMTTEEE
jgi:hypothetical protein